MMTKFLATTAMLAASFAFGLSAPASAKATSATAKMESEGSGSAGTPQKVTPGPKTRYCFNSEVTGSRLPEKICKTKAEWKAEGVEVSAS